MQMHILHHAAEEAIHGAWMPTELRRHGYDISPGSLYPTLHRLEKQCLLKSHREVVDGKTLRRYTATPAGESALAEARNLLAELASEVLGVNGESGRG